MSEMPTLGEQFEAAMERVAALEASLAEVASLAVGWAGYFKAAHDLSDIHDTHKQIINRAQRLLGGRELV